MYSTYLFFFLLISYTSRQAAIILNFIHSSHERYLRSLSIYIADERMTKSAEFHCRKRNDKMEEKKRVEEERNTM